MKARIIFDLDGTLIDSAPDINEIANSALRSIGASPISLPETHEFIGEGISKFVEKMRIKKGLTESLQIQLVDEMTKNYDDAVSLTTPYPGVVDALKVLSGSNSLGICTNKLISPTKKVLAHLGLNSYFDILCGGDNPLGLKPNPAGLLDTFSKMDGEICIFIGDSEVDAETARRASLPFLLFTEGYRKSSINNIPHLAAFDKYSDLPELIWEKLQK